jgi:ribosome maturation factor RimP
VGASRVSDDSRTLGAEAALSTKDRIRPTIEAPLHALGLVIEDVAVTPVGKRRLVRVYLDRDLSGLADDDDRSPVPPLTLDEVADATRAVSAALDESDAMGPQPYVLEVTSPGVERPLTEPRHFRRNVGRLVAFTTAGGDSLTARLVAADTRGVTVAVEGAAAGEAADRQLTYADVARAHVQVEFARGGEEEDD